MIDQDIEETTDEVDNREENQSETEEATDKPNNSFNVGEEVVLKNSSGKNSYTLTINGATIDNNFEYKDDFSEKHNKL